MNELDELARQVQHRQSVPYARPVAIREPSHGPGYYLAGLALLLWTCLCIGLAGWVVYTAATDQSPPTFGELGAGGGIASNWSAGDQGTAINDYVREQRIRGALVVAGGIGIGWAVFTVPLTLVMIACKK